MSFRPYNQLAATSIADKRTNNTGTSIPAGTPVRINASGELDFVDVSVEAQALSIVGVASQSIPNNGNGNFSNSGKIENINSLADFGDIIYVSKSGTLTNSKPSVGVSGFQSGDFIISVGVIAKNEENPSLKDLVINVNIVGQL